MGKLIILAAGTSQRFLEAVRAGLREADVLCADSEERCRQLAENAPPQLIFLGAGAGNDMAEVCGRLRQSLPRAPLVIVAPADMTGMERDAALHAGANAILADTAGGLEIAGLARAIAAGEDSFRHGESEAVEILRQVFQAESDGVFLVDNEDGRILEVNPAAARIYGYATEEMVGLRTVDLSAEPERTMELMRQTPPGSDRRVLRRHRKKDGTVFPVEISARFFTLRGRSMHVSAIRDMTAVRRQEEEREAMIRILRTVGSENDLRGFIRELTGVLQEWSGCEAVGVRLQDGRDFPYFETAGFPPAFVVQENSLCAAGPDGKALLDRSGNPVLECMCGNVICGRFDPGKPFFTEYGSFWTNSTNRLLASTSEQDRQARTRNRCNGEGYESVALIPLRAGGRTLGLVQFNDRREGRFTPERIAMLERAAASIAVGLDQRQTLEALHKSERQQRAIIESAMDGFWYVDRGGRVLEVNETYCRMSGYSRDELLSMSIPAVEAIESAGEVADRIQGLKVAGEGRFESRHRRKDGSVFDVEVSVQHRVESGSLVVFIRDITERKRAERVLRENAARQSFLVRLDDALRPLADPEDIEFEAARVLGEHLGASRTGYAEALDEDGTVFIPRHYCRGVPAIDGPHRLDDFGTHVLPRLRAGNGVIYDDVRRDAALSASVKAAFESLRVRAMANIPLVKEKQLKAVLFVHFGEVHTFAETELSLMESVAERTWAAVERARARKKLQESEEMFRAFVEQAADAIFVHDFAGRFIEVNPQGCASLGYTRDELLGMNVTDVEVDFDLESAQAVIRPEQQSSLKGRHRRKDGTVFPVEVRFGCFELRGERVFLGLVRDVSERERSQQDLELAHLRLNIAVASGRLGIWEWDIHSGAIAWDDRMFELYGLSREQVQVHYETWLNGVHPEDRAAAHAAVQAALQGKRPYDIDFRVARPDGTVRHVKADGIVVPDQHGRPVRMIGLNRDISDRKQAELALQKSHGLLSNLARLVPGVIYQYRLYPDGRSAFPYSSPGIFDIYEVTPEEVREDATPVFGRLHPEDRDRVTELILESARTLDIFYCEFRVVLPRQGLRWRWCQAHPERMPDGGTLWHGIISDITERKLAEEEKERLTGQLLQAQKMESIGRLAGGVAHDFNNLLTVINGYGKMALDSLHHTDPLRDSLEEICKSGDRAAGLTRQLLAFSRKQILQPRVLDLGQVLENMRSMLRRLMGEDVELQFSPHPECPSVHADPHQIEQVIMNLAVNARDAMPKGGRLRIETRPVEWMKSGTGPYPGAPSGRYAALSVTDTGTGMSDATRQRIFEPFFTTKGQGKGTGLGLSTVQGIVAQSGGHIAVNSEPGKGTTFSILLPAETGSPAPQPRPEPLAEPAGRETILIVEDQTEVRAFVTAVMKKCGYEVLSAENAGQALDLFQQNLAAIDLVLTDVVMPQTSGPELVARLEALRPGVKALFMSGYTDDVTVQHGVLEQGVHFIQKPFTPEELARAVRSLLGQPA